MKDIVEFVKHALSNQPNRDSIKNKLKSAVDSDNMLDILLSVRDNIFPPNQEPIVQPEELNPEFIDFLSDNGMWDWINKHAGKKLSTNDQEAVDIIHAAVKDLVDNNKIFTDITYTEKDL